MSDTPETEAAMYYSDATGRCVVDVAFACKLERERNQLRAQLADAQQTIEDVCTGAQLHTIPQ